MDDYWIYVNHGDSLVIESVDGDLLIGDQLPRTEKEARLLCRCANIARRKALAEAREKVRAAVEVATR